MIAHLRGRVAARTAGTVVVDVAGVGYLVHVAGGEVPPRGEPGELHTSLQVREDSMTLYGFADRASLELFELLLTSSGVGPKLALAALSTHPPDQLRAAIAEQDLDLLTLVPGIGKKVAQRLILELRDKVGGVGEFEVKGGDGAAAPSTPRAEVREALLGLGYSAGEVHAALADVDGADDPSELLRGALRVLAAGVGSGGSG
ncbi:MAG: Holliday junction branch migration protein RuvA [Nitriliruptorales bacterium]|nr:Holliday junction branch migration protein RuvA [Nitriliruptorales bacterium]